MKMNFEQWDKFKTGDWQEEINVRDFIQKNYTPYEGDSSFLEGSTEKSKKLWDEIQELFKKERESYGGVLDIDTKTISTVAAHDVMLEAGLSRQEREKIVDKVAAVFILEDYLNEINEYKTKKEREQNV